MLSYTFNLGIYYSFNLDICYTIFMYAIPLILVYNIQSWCTLYNLHIYYTCNLDVYYIGSDTLYTCNLDVDYLGLDAAAGVRLYLLYTVHLQTSCILYTFNLGMYNFFNLDIYYTIFK
jgi:hypothetical protein